MISGLILKSLNHFEIFLYVVWESSPVWFSCIELPSLPITIYWRCSCLLGCRLIDRLNVDSLLGFSVLSRKGFSLTYLRAQYGSKGRSSTQSFRKAGFSFQLIYLSSKASVSSTIPPNLAGPEGGGGGGRGRKGEHGGMVEKEIVRKIWEVRWD